MLARGKDNSQSINAVQGGRERLGKPRPAIGKRRARKLKAALARGRGGGWPEAYIRGR
jgi:hypothetical protein